MRHSILRLMLACLVVPLAPLVTSTARAQTLTSIYSFTAQPDGATPETVLIRDKDGNLYGTTCCGGTSGWGTVFKVDTSGNETVLVSFGPDTAGAVYPSARLIMDKLGNLYGTTLFFDGEAGHGSVFKVDTSGKFVLLHQFVGAPDGDNPDAGLVMDEKGNLYGTTEAGGSFNLGTIFKVDSIGRLTLLHSFTGSDGQWPVHSDLILDKNGNLYGTAFAGGSASQGTVFKLDTAGHATVLHNFIGADGAFPMAGLMMDKKGNLYGTTSQGGISNAGTVFKLDPAGNETVLHSFTDSPDGAYATGGVVMDKKGNLYGSTYLGGSTGNGTVFEVDKTGNESVLHNFTDMPDGAFAVGGLLIDKKGTLYGTTANGGTYGYGMVFELVP